MSLKKIAHAAFNGLPYHGWKVRFLEDEQTVEIDDGKQKREFKGKSITKEWHQQEALTAAHKWIRKYETTSQDGEIQDYTLLLVMVKQALDQAKCIENKFTKMDKQRLKLFINGAQGLVRQLEIRMDNGPKEFEESTYLILEFMEEVNKVALSALLEGKGDQFQQLIDVYKKHHGTESKGEEKDS